MFDLESIRSNLPSHLHGDRQMRLFDDIKKFPHVNYFTTLHPQDMLQGDGWTELEVFKFDGSKKSIRGIILSNSCDIDASNQRDFPSKINFAPIIKLSNYQALLERVGLDTAGIEGRISSIRKQEITNIFYLPAETPLESEHIALLDDIHTIDLNHYQKNQSKQKIYTLSQIGFYAFLFKLSVHFCRTREGLIRDA